MQEVEKKLKILIIRLSSMGDVILSSVLPLQIKKKYPNSEIHFVVDKHFAEVYKYNPRIDKLIEYDKSATLKEIVDLKNELKNNLDTGFYDIVIDLQRNLRSKIFRSGLSKSYLYVHKLRLHKLSLVYAKKSLLKQIIPIPDLYINTAQSLGIDNENAHLELWFPEEESNIYPPLLKNEYDESQSEDIVISIAPGAFHKTKRLPEEKFVELINKLINQRKFKINIIGGIKDKKVTDFIKSKINGEINDFSESKSILKTAEVIDKSDLVISNDTGIMHIAAARKVPVIAIFGSTVKEFGFIPYQTKFKIIEKELPCRPCTHIGREECPKYHFNCMNLIEVDEIISSIYKLLNFQ